MEYDVVISYSRNDKETMRQLYNDLKVSGFKVWTDEAIEQGTSAWQMEIERAIDTSRSLVVILSPDARASEWVRNEIVAAKELKLPIFGFHIKGEPSRAIPLDLKSTQRIDAREDYAAALQKLIEAMHNLTGRKMDAAQKSSELSAINSSEFNINKPVDATKAPFIAQYIGRGWGACISLRDCPDLTEGWLMSAVQVKPQSHENFVTPYEKEFQVYFSGKREDFKRDGRKLILTQRPSASTDEPDLVLETTETRFSMSKFYAEEIAPNIQKRDTLIAEIFSKSLINFAHALCLHAVVVTQDDKVLIVKRPPYPQVRYYANLWQCSLSEQIKPEDDLKDGLNNVVLSCAKRMLWEELGLSKGYREEQFKILSVFLEAEILNVSLCAYIKLDITSDELDLRLRYNPPKDYEFTDLRFMGHQQLLGELFKTEHEYHPTAQYLMLMTLLHRDEKMRDIIFERITGKS